MHSAHIRITGIVQGVGFRPFVYNLAVRLGLTGWVRNTSAGVEIQVDGEPAVVQDFLRRLRDEAPSLARIDSLQVSFGPPNGFQTFEILHSQPIPSAFQPISPDVAICGDCLRELFDPADRRYRYPFINCTNCGPRFTIIRDIPYDRPQTTMAVFPMCAECAREYHDPADRRFHAQPVACPACGPHVWLERGGETLAVGDQAIRQARLLLQQGYILAIKGLGGFHLACDATRAEVVTELRRRKLRVDKPFALMMPDLATVEQHCFLPPAGRHLLTSSEAPIVLLERRPESTIAPEVAPGQHTLGVMLPYTPLHYLLFADPDSPPPHFDLPPLVMTSGNLSEEPIVTDNQEARQRLASLADAFLFHNRDIYIRCDDSVIRIVNRSPGGGLPSLTDSASLADPPRFRLPRAGLADPEPPSGPDRSTLPDVTSPDGSPHPAGDTTPAVPGPQSHPQRPTESHPPSDATPCAAAGSVPHLAHSSADIAPTQAFPYPIRRSRGYTPFPVKFPFEAPHLLATGAELKNTFCLTNGRYAFLSHHIGDMENYETLRSFEQGIEHFERLFRVQPLALACDLHPDYLATRYALERAERQGLPVFSIQHHHAHIAACMAENGLDGSQPLIGLAFDGTGYGDDGTIWGGEILLADYRGYRRLGHLEPFPLPGGDAAIRKPARTALALLWALGLDWDERLAPVQALCAEDRLRLRAQLQARVNTPLTSSLGRLFDAAAALAGGRQTVNYEAQAAIEFEAAVDPLERGAYPFVWNQDRVQVRTAVEALIADVLSGVPFSVIAARFHNGLVQVCQTLCLDVRQRFGVNRVALSGGVWQNITLLGRTLSLLEAEGFTVYIHREVPTNDGGLSLGQAVIAAERWRAQVGSVR